MENNLLTDEQALALEKVLIKDNEKIIGLHFEQRCYGCGGSNNSPATVEVNFDRTLDELAEQSFKDIFGVYVCAVVNDVVYLIKPTADGKKVISFGASGQYDGEYGIAYDTVRGFVIRPILK